MASWCTSSPSRAVLRYLLERTHRRVPAFELLTAVWRGEQVSCGSVHTAICALRKAIAPVELSVSHSAGWQLHTTLESRPALGDRLGWRAYACAKSESGAEAAACIAHADLMVAAEVERYGT